MNELPKESLLSKHHTATFILAGIIGFLFMSNSIAGIAFSGELYHTPVMYVSFLPNDYINLFFGLPILIVSMLMWRHGQSIGLIGLTAALIFILYNNIAYLFAVRNVFSLIANTLIVSLCIIQLILLLKILSNVRGRLKEPCIRRPGIYGAILVAAGILFIARAVMNLLNSALGQIDLSIPEIGVNIADVVICPLWIISGILMFRKKRFGYIAGVIAYLQGSMLFFALIVFMIIQPLLCGTEFIATDLLVIAIMGMTFFIPCFVLGNYRRLLNEQNS